MNYFKFFCAAVFSESNSSSQCSDTQCSSHDLASHHSHQPDFLTKYNMEYRDTYGLLVCRTCSLALGHSFSTHLQDKHKISVSITDKKTILSKCFAKESPYFHSSDVPLPGLDFVPIMDGFKCSQCCHYFLKEKSARGHARDIHGDRNSIVPCKVQTLCSDSATRKTYFGVQSIEEASCESSCDFSSSHSIASVVDKTMEVAMQSIPVQQAESIREANLFYVMMNWVPQPGGMPATFSCICDPNLLHVPVEGEEYYNTAKQIKDIFLNSLSCVSSIGFQLRTNINISTNVCRGPKTFTPPLTCLETTQSREEYARLFTSLLFFAHNILLQHPDILDTQTVEFINAAFTTTSRSSVFGAICSFLKEYTPTNSESGATIPLFVKCRCYLQDGTLLSLDDVSRICAKLIYLAKLSVLETVMDKEERHRVTAMEELKPLVELNNYNIFSFLCRVQSAARRVMESSNRMPCVLSTIDPTNPWTVVVGGISFQLESLQAAYNNALIKCQTMMEKMLLGMEGLNPKNVYDNLISTPHIMAHQDPSIDHRHRVSLLRHILTKEELRTRFVLSIVGPGVLG